MNIKDNNEKWYFKNSFIFSFLCFLSLFPFGAIWAIPILYYKNKNTDKILDAAYDDAYKEVYGELPENNDVIEGQIEMEFE